MTDSIQTNFLHKGSALAFLSVLVVELMTIVFHLRDPSQIGSKPEFRGFRLLTAGNDHQTSRDEYKYSAFHWFDFYVIYTL